jgi:hypothetical protein
MIVKVAIVVSQSVVVGHHHWIKPRSDNDHRAIPSNQATNSGDLVVITTGQMPSRWLKPLITISTNGDNHGYHQRGPKRHWGFIPEHDDVSTCFPEP